MDYDHVYLTRLSRFTAVYSNCVVLYTKSTYKQYNLLVHCVVNVVYSTMHTVPVTHLRVIVHGCKERVQLLIRLILQQHS